MSAPAVLVRTLRAEWSRLWTVRSTWVLVVLLALAVAGLGALAGYDAAQGAGFDPVVRTAWDDARFTMLFLLFGTVALSCVATASDYGSGGILPTLQWTPRRGVLLTGRTVVVAGTSVVLAMLLLTVAAELVAVQASDLGLPADVALTTLRDVALVVGSGSVLGIGLGLLTRSTAGSLVSAIALLIVLPLVLGNVPYDSVRTVAAHLPGTGAVFVVFGDGPFEDMTRTSATWTLLAWAAGMLLLGGLRLLRTDATR